MKDRVVEIAADIKGLSGLCQAAADTILSSSRVQIELIQGQQSEQNQSLELQNTGHCGATVTPNYDQAAWLRFQHSGGS